MYHWECMGCVIVYVLKNEREEVALSVHEKGSRLLLATWLTQAILVGVRHHAKCSNQLKTVVGKFNFALG